MRCLRFSFKHITGCFLALLSLNLVGAYGAEDKSVGSPSGTKAMELEISSQVEHSTLTSVNASPPKRQAKKRKKAVSAYQDDGADENNTAEAKEVRLTQAPMEMEVDVFSELTDSSPVIFLSPTQSQCNFSVPWAGGESASVTVHSWNDKEEEFNRKAMDGIDVNYSISREGKPTLTGSIDSSILMSSSSSEFQIMVTNSNLEEGLFTKIIHVVVLDPKNINNIVLVDGNAVDDALEKYSQYSTPDKKSKSRKKATPKKKLFIVASNPKKTHVLFQLPNTLAMTKEDILRNAKLLEDTLKPKDEPMGTDDEEAQFRQEQWESLSQQLAELKVEAEGEDEVDKAGDEADVAILDWLKHKFSPPTDELAFREGTEDAFVDPTTLHTVLGPVKTTSDKVQGISIEPWSHLGGDLANSRFMHIYPADHQLLVNLYGHHFPASENGYFKVRWIRNAEQFATSHMMLITPEVLKKSLVVLDLSTRELRNRSEVDIEKVMREITNIEGISDAVIVVVGKASHLPIIRRYLKDYTSLFFPENDNPRLEYLKLVIIKFTGTKTVRKPYPGNAIFWEPNLGLEEVSFQLKTFSSAPMGGWEMIKKQGYKRQRVATDPIEPVNSFEVD